MEKEQLQRFLFSENTRLFCVLDGASVPKLPMRLYEEQVPNHCIYPGDLGPRMTYAAPYVAVLFPESKFTEWVFTEGFGKHWGIFVQSPRSLMEMRRHFRSILHVYGEDARTLIFRYYDPRVLNKYLPTCNGSELKTFFGEATAIFAESEDAKDLLRYRFESGKLVKKVLNAES